VTGWYRATSYFIYRNSGVVQKPTLNLLYVDPDITSTNAYFTAASGTPGQVLNGSQASTMGNNQAVVTSPLVFYALGGQFVNIKFQDPGGTPNDLVSS